MNSESEEARPRREGKERIRDEKLTTETETEIESVRTLIWDGDIEKEGVSSTCHVPVLPLSSIWPPSLIKRTSSSMPGQNARIAVILFCVRVPLKYM